ncbi:MAG: sulfurtransferase TusA family protein [Actinomycetota bacterium]|nr:sulfurtransferase TusA family protein [Actinomycetota bacterium]
MQQTGSGRTLVDSRGSSCPGPITDLALAYRRSKRGDVIELWATDPGVKPDLQAWASKTRNEIVSIDDQGDKIVAVLKIVNR